MRIFRAALGMAALAGVAVPASAGEVHVAVAANFTDPAKEIAAAFRRRTGNDAVLSFGSSGAFYTQIAQGAPFEVFLSADNERPAKAEQDGLAVPGTRFTYAVGTLALYSTRPGLVDQGGGILRRGTFDKIAIADPLLAPYGTAAMETMGKLGVTANLRPKLVKGGSITQTYQFVATGAAEIGFVAYSQIARVPGGSRWIVPAKLHAPIEQQAVLLRTGAADRAAISFMKFLKSPAAGAIIRKYGYALAR
ncbi:molybdate ABC transporter substrate-binding protein [Novosphingobium colocasiae]|uniref:Molybdate ABC transporter substrate-binding protein n=1 Tax=Novosphingobium colocasiae TaxID=1256513 RepID=A0A918PEA9_9SPHN|nr:molybdate ABC transporter substrate-binding protein [Novosphingobium colocasiae]GGZ03467.1 molybdate ABC transporter substrate-binding protein [Novosphingobium colocasiae]